MFYMFIQSKKGDFLKKNLVFSWLVVKRRYINKLVHFAPTNPLS